MQSGNITDKKVGEKLKSKSTKPRKKQKEIEQTRKKLGKQSQ